MDIKELQDYRLSDAVKFHNHLNPKIWGSNEHLLPEVREKLAAIAADFIEFLGLDLEVKDVTISGSNASYTYSDHSDIDLHVVADLPKADASEIYRELFDAKKYQYNDQHNYKIGGYDVELYVQNANEDPVSQGIYSVANNEWIKVPARRKPTVNDESVKSKYEDIGHRIEAAIESGDASRLEDIASKVRTMRQCGLDKTGEFGPENLAFKVLRSNGTLEKLRTARMAAKDRALSIAEAGKEKKRIEYGFRAKVNMEDWHPNEEPPGPESKPEMPRGTVLVDVSDTYDWYKLGQDISDLDHADPEMYGQGAPQTILSFGSEPLEHKYLKKLEKLGLKTHDIDPGGKKLDRKTEFRVNENKDTIETQLQNFIKFCAKQLELEQIPKIQIKRDPAWSERNSSFGRYMPDSDTLIVSIANRHPLDAMRTMAHELTHRKQDEQQAMPIGAGETGSKWENDANARAGILMRDFADLHPEYFGKEPIREASGYIPVNAEEARDPRYSMALTVDIKPGENQRQAAKMGWKTDPAGKPPTARTNGLMESLQRKLEQVKAAPLNEDQLDEVNMSPGALANWAKSAGNMQSGFEAELIFTGLGDEEEYDPEYEPDYSYDTRPDSIDEIIDFFQTGDFADLSDRAADRIRRHMEEEYMTWLDEKMMDDWAVDQDDEIRRYLQDEEELEGEELDTRTDAAMADQNRDYDNALEVYTDNWRSDSNYNEADWLRSAGIRSMSDAAAEYDELYWPHMEDLNSGMGGDGEFSEASAKRLADDLSETLGVETTVSTGYHGAERDATTWIFEPDSSLEGNESGDMPVEIVSPPMPLNQTLEILPKFFKWAAANGGYANKSTGFHMSVSMPEHEGKQLDFTKLALFLGDKYVLEQFGRAGNSYAASAIDKIKSRKGDVNPEAVMNAMRNHLNQFASRALAQPSGFGKYVTINPKTNYVEFRSAGGKDYFEDMDKVQNTMMRYARALSIAMDPDAEKQEYGKKLYKLLTDAETYQVKDPKTGKKRTEAKTNFEKDAISVFSRYASGTLPRAALSAFIKTIQSERETKRQAAEGKPMIWQVNSGPQGMKIVATGERAAKLRGAQEWNIDPNSERFDSIRAVPVGPAPTSVDNLSKPKFPRGRDQVSNTNHWVVSNEHGDTVAYLRGRTEEDIIKSINTWANEKGVTPEDFSVRPADTWDIERGRERGMLDTPVTQTPAADDPNGNYVLRRREGDRGVGPILYRFQAAGGREAIEAARQWTQARGVDRLSVYLDSVANVPDEILNARPEPTASAAPTRGSILPGSSRALALQRAYPNVVDYNRTSETGQWVIYSNTSYDNIAIVPATTGPDALEQYHRWMSAGDHRDSYGMRPADATDIRLAQNTAGQAQELEPEVAQNFQQPAQATSSAGVPLWEIYSIRNGYVFKTVAGQTQDQAQEKVQQWMRSEGIQDPSSFGLRPKAA